MGTPEGMRRGRFARRHVIVAGGGVAALEACLALGRHRARVTLIAPNAVFAHRPPGTPSVGLPLATVAGGSGAALLHDRVIGVEPERRRVQTAGGRELRYDALLLATGAAGRVPSVPPEGRPAVLVAPPGPIWRLELYELALDIASASTGRDVVLETTEERPLELLGPRASSLAAAALLAAGVRVRTGAYATAITSRGARVWPAGELVEGAVVEASRLTGRLPAGIPADAGGFAQADPLGRVAGVEHVYAAGDCTAFPVKHASLAAEQADAAVATIAGAPAPFEPVLRWVLPVPARWYVEVPIEGGHGDAAQLTTRRLWRGPASFGSRHLTPLLGDERTPPPPRRDRQIDPVRRALRRHHASPRA